MYCWSLCKNSNAEWRSNYNTLTLYLAPGTVSILRNDRTLCIKDRICIFIIMESKEGFHRLSLVCLSPVCLLCLVGSRRIFSCHTSAHKLFDQLNSLEPWAGLNLFLGIISTRLSYCIYSGNPHSFPIYCRKELHACTRFTSCFGSYHNFALS